MQSLTLSCRGSLSGYVANSIFFNFRNSQIQERFGGKPLTTADVVQMVSGVVYNRRFNSCIDSIMLGAIDVNGYGSVFLYDDLGRFKRVAYKVEGPVANFIENYLLTSRKNGMTEYDIVDMIKQAYISGTAQDFPTGESLEIIIIKTNGVQRIMQKL
jgi:20S proteasome alpha/beta subunit